MKNSISGADALLRMLEAYQVEYIFGLCGDTTLPFYDSILTLNHSIEHILVRDERTAAYMADGYARTTGKVGVCEGPSGGGATYILPGLIEANESSSAILSITTDISLASYGKFPLTEVDQEALMRPLTKWNTVIRRGDHIPRMVRKAFRMMTTGRPGSTHLGIPYDIQYEDVSTDDIWSDKSHFTFPAWRSAPEPGLTEEVLQLVTSSENPVIVCGGGVVIANAMAELRKFVEYLNLPVLTSISGQGSLSDFHSNCAGVVGSNGGTDETWSILENADLVLFLGCRAGSTTTSRWQAPTTDTRIIHIDSDPEVIGANYKTELGIAADLFLVLQELNQLLDQGGFAGSGFKGSTIVTKAKEEKFRKFQETALLAKEQINPEAIVLTLQDILSDDAIIVCDPGTPCPYISAFYQFPKAGRHFITNRAHGALGYSLGAAMGAWCGTKNKEVIAIMGDGSFGFSCGELETLTRIGIPITIIVISNKSFGWIKASQHDEYEQRYHNVDFSRTDHAKIAADYGLKSWRVEKIDDLAAQLSLAVKTEEPTLVDIVCQPLEQANAPVLRWMG